MDGTLLLISNGEILLHDGNRDIPVSSGVLESYKNKLRESARRNEWKNSGSGAKFTGTYMPGESAEDKLSTVRAFAGCLGCDGDTLVYSLNISGTAGIYRKSRPDDNNEGIVISNGEVAYADFDIKDGRMAVSSSFAGESHIGVLDIATGHCDTYTDGPSWDSEPVFSASRPDRIYFCTSGLAIKEQTGEKRETPQSLPQMMLQAYSDSGIPPKGPTSVCLLDIKAGTMDEILTNPSYDYVHPQSIADGSLYYIRRPYKQKSGSNPGGCLLDIILFPGRLIASLFGFLNFFSMKYSGKALSKAGNTKKQDEGKLFIDGNLIEAEKELKANRSRGDKFPGIIPRSWELHQMHAGGTDELIRRGVAAYRVIPDTGEIVMSNGSCVLLRHADGSEEKISDTPRVSFILKTPPHNSRLEL